MITRAQAEALLTLAESLEACEQVGLDIASDQDGAVVYWGNYSVSETPITGMQIRVLVSKLIPKQEI